jgi:hypothetical protein
LLIYLGSIATVVTACGSQNVATVATTRPGAFDVSFVPGARDDAGRFMGGTEIRVLAGHAGKLYAGNGYWEDRPGPEGLQRAQILVLDGPGHHWRVDHTFEERLPGGRPRHLAVSVLETVTFGTDGVGVPLRDPVSLLIAATWDLGGTTRVFSRDDETDAWAEAALGQDRPTRNVLPQIRSLSQHRDQFTRVDRVFAGQNPRGIFSGTYDASVAGHIRWSGTPELELSGVSSAGLSGPNGYVRISSFAECSGHLYAAIGQHIYERIDGATPQWRLVYTNRNPGHSETGLRGLTTIPDPSGHGEVLLAAVEGNAARIVRVDPRDGSEVTELTLAEFLSQQWAMPVGYVIAAYNDMAKAHARGGGEVLLIGLEAFIPPRAAIAADHSIISVGYGRLEAGGWYLVRHATGHYDLHQIAAPNGRALVAVRAIRASPFPQELDAVYFAGYDANKAPAHDTGWVYRSTSEAAISGLSR